MYTTELESMAGLCFRAFDGANYEARYAVAKLLGTLVASTQQPMVPSLSGNFKNVYIYSNVCRTTHNLHYEYYTYFLGSVVVKNTKEISLDDAFGVLMSGFLRGGTGLLKGTGEIIKGSSAINREVRVGVTRVSYIWCTFEYFSVWFLIRLSSSGLRRFYSNSWR